MTNIPGWQRRIALNLYKKETSYGAGGTINSTNGCELSGYDSEPRDWPDDLADDANDITGSEFPLTQEILRQKVEIPYSESKAKPNSLAGIAALTLGNVTSVQDGAFAAYRHKIIPIAAGSPLPSIIGITKDSTQYIYSGLCGKSLEIEGKEDGFVGFKSKLIGNGSRAGDATAFPSKILESWMKTTQMKVFYESGSSISVSSTPTQLAEDISSGAGTDLSIRIKNFKFGWDNNNFMNYGFGSIILQEQDKGAKRTASLNFSLLYKDDTELNHYLNQTTVAVEFDAAGTIIAAGGAFKYGMDLIIPALKLKKVGLKGTAGDFLTQDFEATIIDDGTNPIVQLYVYNAKAAYLA